MNNITTIRLIDDDEELLKSLKSYLSMLGWHVRTYASAEDFLMDDRHDDPGCIVLDVAMPGMKGTELQEELTRRKVSLPIIFLSGNGTIAMAVNAMQRGAVTFLEKPVAPHRLRSLINEVIADQLAQERSSSVEREAQLRWRLLTEREKEVARLIAQSALNKTIADQLGISVTTVKTHRANIFAKFGVKTAVEFTKAMLAAGVQ